jgi:hypothetical protein
VLVVQTDRLAGDVGRLDARGDFERVAGGDDKGSVLADFEAADARPTPRIWAGYSVIAFRASSSGRPNAAAIAA